MIGIIVTIILVLYGLSYVLPVDAENTTYGSAKFTSKGVMHHKKNGGWILDGDKKGLSLQESCSHLSLICSSGSGKTTTLVIPNLIVRNDWSWVVTDPKGELTHLLNPYYASLGYKVYVMDFDDPQNSIRFNPLHRLQTESDIKGFVNDLSNVTHGNKGNADPFWPTKARGLIELLLRCTMNMPAQFQNLGTVISILNHLDDGKKGEYFFYKYAPDEYIKEKFKSSYLDLEVKIKMGVKAQAQSMLHALDTASIRYMISNSAEEINFSRFREEKSVLFIKLKPGRQPYAPIVSLFLGHLFQHLIATPVNDTDLPLGILLEELQNLNRVPMISEAISLLRSRVCPMMIISQTKAGLEDIYGLKTTKNLLANTNALILPGIRELETLKMYRDLIGSTSYTDRSAGGRKTRRDLISIDELRRMTTSIFLSQKGNPVKINPLPIYLNIRLMEQAGLISENGKLKSLHPVEKQPRKAIHFPHHSYKELIGEAESKDKQPPKKDSNRFRHLKTN